jgi:acetylornithine deacetylase/succinyl-diaminopimelate desuccinylase-like protein
MGNIENVTLVLNDTLPQVSGKNVEDRLINLATIGGEILLPTPEQPTRYSVSRLALSNKDIEARKFLEKQMLEAGMSVTQEAFATIGYYQGTNPELKPILIVSHHDSIPNGGMYDGTVGVNAGIEVVNILNRNGITFPHPIIVVSFTEEESSRFNTGLGGSKALTQGLTDAELDQTDKIGISKRTALENIGFDPQQSKIPHPLFSQKNALASIEIHVEQNTRLANTNIELGIVEAIAAPIRYKINIEQPSQESINRDNNIYLNIDVTGRSGHSGATPMTLGARADALVTQSEILIHLNALQNKHTDTQIHIGNMALNDDASINKIPGSSHLSLRLNGDNSEKIIQDIKKYIERRNQQLRKNSYLTTDPIKITETTNSDGSYNDKLSIRSFSTAAYFIKSVQSITSLRLHQHEDTVGTVGTFLVDKNGHITLGVDLRGKNKTDRDSAASKIDEIRSKILTKKVTGGLKIACTKEEIAGSSGDPTQMDGRLVELAEKIIKENNISSYIRTFSPAGHDTQNIARIGIPTVMFFIPSRNNGAAHNPDEYSTSKDLENGAKALMSMIYKLASIPTNDLPQITT